MSDACDLRVALDMTQAVVGMTGVRRYAQKAVEQLRTRPGLTVRSFAVGRAAPGAPRVDHRYPVPLRVAHRLWETIGHPRAESFVPGADVVHALGGLPPPTRRPLVLTVHDLLPLSHPQFFSPRIRREAAGVARAVHRATLVVATCHATADEIAGVTGFSRADIVVAPLGPREPPDEQRAPARPRGPYLLTIGAITPRKGLDVLAEAVARLGPSAPPVVAVGPDGLFSDDTRRAVAARDTYGRFSFVGEVDDDRLASLLANATIVCHPSRAEGFGMVCLEAMAYGRAVVATDLPSVRELGDEGVLLTPVDDADALAGAIEHLLRDDDARMALGASGRTCAANYTWDAFAEAIVGAYERAVSRRSSS